MRGRGCCAAATACRGGGDQSTFFARRPHVSPEGSLLALLEVRSNFLKQTPPLHKKPPAGGFLGIRYINRGFFHKISPHVFLFGAMELASNMEWSTFSLCSLDNPLWISTMSLI